MVKTVVMPTIAFCLCFAMPAMAQRGGGRAGHGGGMRGGSFGGFRGGFNHNRSFGGNFGFRHFPRAVIYPAFYGGFGFGYSDPYFSNPYPYPVQNYASYSSNPAPVIITQNYYSAPAPRVEEYRPESAPSQPRQEEASLYLIAFKDHTIRAVLAYWADGATLHYVTMDHEQKQTTVNSVDRDLSERLNRERNVRFGLKQ